MSVIFRIDADTLSTGFSAEQQDQATEQLEHGSVLYFPSLPFVIKVPEQRYLSANCVHPKHKNISYDVRTDSLKGTVGASEHYPELVSMMQRFAGYSRRLVLGLLPSYEHHLEQARTSYRPVEVKARLSSYRKDDSRLHVDSFPSTPVGGKRILRVFANVNPRDEPRVWRVGESFCEVAGRFLPDIRQPLPFEAPFLQLIRATKNKRSAYDHYMMNIHNRMKADMDYQGDAIQHEVQFQPGTTWMAFTDQVSHAAMSGQFLLEQTFYLQVEGMLDLEAAPLNILEKALNRPLL